MWNRSGTSRWNTYRVVGLDLPVEEPVLLDPGVAVHGPDEPERVPPRVVLRLGPEDGRRGAPVHLDVPPARK